MKNLIMLVAVVVGLMVISCSRNPFEPEKPETRYIEVAQTNVSEVSQTNVSVVTVTNGQYIYSNKVERTQDEYYLVPSSYYSANGYVNFYFAFIQTNRTIVLYKKVNYSFYVEPDFLSNRIVENGWLRVPDPSSNYLGVSMQVKVLWDEWTVTVTNIP